MDTGLKDKVVVVTGAGAGMGREIATAFSREGAAVIVTDIDDAAGAETVAMIKAKGGWANYHHLDVSCKSEMQVCVDDIVRAQGRIDVMINNAGIVSICEIEDMSEDTWDRMQAVNVKSILFSLQAIVPVMRDQGGGKIINLCSQLSKMAGSMPYAHYSASKAAAWNLTMAAAKRYASIPININAVAPGSIAGTDFSREFNLSTDPEEIGKAIPMRRRGEPADVAPAVVFLASEGARYITGELIDINGGGLMD